MNKVGLTQVKVITGVLYGPASFKTASLKTLNEVCNGCGSASAKFDYVPDTIYGMYIGYCCNIHDWMYNKGRTIEDKFEADRTMLNNIVRLIELDKKWYRPKWVKRLMMSRAEKYYYLVKHFAGPAFWKGKGI